MSLFGELQRVRVLLPMSKGNVFDYAVPPEQQVGLGSFVKIPLGPREVTGVVWELDPKIDFDPSKLREILEVLPCPPLPDDVRELVDWVANYTLQSPGRVLRMSMSVPEALVPKAPRMGYRLKGEIPEKLTPARRKVLELLESGLAYSNQDISQLAGVSTGVVKGLFDKGIVEKIELPDDVNVPIPDWRKAGFDLSEDQTKAANALKDAVKAEAYSATLLQGVTGSGKTEVYFEAIAEALSKGQQALVMLPEIALSSQWLERFEKRFGVKPVVWHSDIGVSERRRNWRAVIEGKARVVVGARSSLFLPYRNLGLIIVDEEHEASFKQDEGITYNARDMAVVRARLGQFPVVLASATPSLETVVNVRTGKYEKIVLPSRFGAAVLPDISIVDLKENRTGAQKWISEPLRLEIEEALKSGQQAMLFLNRRGYAPLTLCDACGFRLQCPHCSSWLVEHRLSKRLQCHHCGFATRVPDSCPDCEAEDSFKACGPGVERLAEEAAELFPDSETRMIASDTLSGPKAAEEFVAAMNSGEIDLLIGTQIVAKGYHFPNLTLVGVVDADLGLAGGDLRASERTYQLLSQVAGRAGRSELKGKVILQTHLPDHPVIQAIADQDMEAFIESEASMREMAAMPPFGKLSSIIVSGQDLESMNRFCGELAKRAPSGDEFLVMGPAPAPIAMIRGRHRVRFLVKSTRSQNMQAILRKWLKGIKTPSQVRLQIDVDPYNFM